MRRLALLLGLTLVMTACGDDDGDETACQGYAGQEISILGSDFPANEFVFEAGFSLDPNAEYQLRVGEPEECLTEVYNDDYETLVATGNLRTNEEIIDDGTDGGSGSAFNPGAVITSASIGAQTASPGSAVDLDNNVSVHQNSSASDANHVPSYGPEKIDFVLSSEGGNLYVYNPTANQNIPGFAIYDAITDDRVQLFETDLTLADVSSTSAEELGAIFNGAASAKIEIGNSPSIVDNTIFGVVTSAGNRAIVSISEFQAGASISAAEITVEAWVN